MPAFPGARFSNKDARIESGKSSYSGGDARAATENEMRRQVTAIRLRNALDPTRFYRRSEGTGAEKGMPAYAQLGTIVGGGLEPSTVVPRKQRADSVVGELVNDARSVSYSKKKFNEVRVMIHVASSQANGHCQAKPLQTAVTAAPAFVVMPSPYHVYLTRDARPKETGYFRFFFSFFVFFTCGRSTSKGLLFA